MNDTRDHRSAASNRTPSPLPALPRARGRWARARAAHIAAALGLAILAILTSGAARHDETPRLVDFIEPPGTPGRLKSFMLHADLWLGIDARAKLDSIVFALENGARCCQVLNADSLWAVDYTWIYPHNLMPPRWYDAQELFRVGDSLRLGDAAEIQFTFGTCRIGVRAGNYAQAHIEALRHWPVIMPEPLKGRLKLKLERAKKAISGKADTEPGAPR